ncbi:MAG: hypothetical protein A2Z03_02225 [Chloroflexi bacterium RBG_16_56_8]|nr:MAG: hypothetical protein A2Z03_02225 [Chloroflexi bacterium RBG_16_56_8]
MADIIDLGSAREQRDRDTALEAARTAAANIQPGNAGECDLCGEHSMRLVQGACAPCRDKYHLP